MGLAGLVDLSVTFNAAAALLLIGMDWLARHGTGLPGVYYAARFESGWMAPTALALMTAVMLGGVAGRWERRYGGYWPPAVMLGLILVFWVRFGG